MQVRRSDPHKARQQRVQHIQGIGKNQKNGQATGAHDGEVQTILAYLENDGDQMSSPIIPRPFPPPIPSRLSLFFSL